jgi:phosphatidate cytidylyltransferase
MLTRIFTAALLIPLVVLAVLYLSPNSFAVGLGAVALLSLYEWFKLFIKPSKRNSIKFLFGLSIYLLGGIGLMVFASAGELYHYHSDSLLFQILVGFWIGIFLWMWLAKPLKSYPTQIIVNHSLDSFGLGQLAWLLTGYIVVIGFWLGVMTLRVMPTLGPIYILSLFVFVWLADSGAYFIGKKFGQTKIFPKGSPNKTFAGFFGGYFSAVMIAIITYVNLDHLNSMPIWQFILLASVLYLFAVYGDLFESVIKRLQGVKDSGQILPGHGGILDRLDSLYATVPLYTLILTHYLI